ncbi:MAG: 2-amino-4-hydroxy-6-hydroxymethyldihydropteridine diphosphokinase [Pseudomonadota bacterium]
MSAREAADAWLSLGGNLGPVERHFGLALDTLHAHDAISVEDVSGLYRTPPWGDADQPPFLNAVARVATALDPHALLRVLLCTESGLGRHRHGSRRWGPRTLDLDLLLFGNQRSADETLVLPHPRLHERAFVLVPLLERCPGLHIPGIGGAEHCLVPLDQSEIEPVAGPDWWQP